MFIRMKRRTRRQVALPLVLSLFLAYLVIITIVSHAFWSGFRDSVSQNIGQKQNNVQLFMNLMEETARQFSLGGEVPQQTDELSARLDSLALLNKNVLGVAFVRANGQVLTSSRTAGYPTADQLGAVPEIRSFLQTNESGLWLVRTNHLAAYYNNKLYDSTRGALTYLCRFDAAGYLLIDIDPQYLYALFTLSNQTEPELEAVLIDAGGQALTSGSSPDAARHLPAVQRALAKGDTSAADLRHRRLLYFVPLCAGSRMAVTVSFDGVLRQIAELLIPLTVLLAVFLLLSVYVTALLTRTISQPLEVLYHTMHNERLRDTIPQPDRTSAASGEPPACPPPGSS